jgi:Reverse transcriptase (RNA-dependent DNA polymerase)
VAALLSNRTLQTERFGNSSSCTLNCYSGVPQRSVLGPILFSIYVSPVYHIAQSFTMSHQQYDDDILLYIALSALQPHSGQQHLNQCLLSIYSWFSAYGLSLNASRSNTIFLSTRQRLPNLPRDMHVDVASCNIPVTVFLHWGSN